MEAHSVHLPMLPAPEARPERILELFERVVPAYDRLNHLFSLGIDRCWRRRLVRLARLGGGGEALDACTGTGDVAIALARRWPAARLIGLDASAGMLGRAREKLAAAGLEGRVRLQQGDVLDLPFAAGRFDCVTIAFGLRNLAERHRGASEMARVLRPGGRLAVLEFLPPGPTPAGRLYRLYLGRVIPWAGGLLSGSPQTYRHLFTSIASFLPPGKVLGLLQTAGLRGLEFRALSGGIAGLFQGVKE
jgi:demethylmenaquinone methyltransferase/2-methoxy-6-polyprenyl-1,4-benzoquinol methylase